MAPGPEQEQLEKLIDVVLKGGDLQALALFLQKDTYEAAALNCSKQFLSKLDKLFSRGLDQKDVKSASLVFTVLYKCGEKLMLPGGQGLSGVIDQGLVKKTGSVHMVHWFEKCRQLWIQCGPQRDETLLNLSEDFFESVMVVHEACKEGTYKITESFLYPIGQLAADPRINIAVQKEAIRKFNIILDKIPMELKKQRKILNFQEASDIMSKLANHILEGGDYDLQVNLMEALCRMATSTQRKELASRWFSMDYVANAFVKIGDSEFETDCRKFLNLVNGMQTDRRVYSYPCMEVYLDNHALLKPSDDKLEEYWIDFNVGSHSTSFYFSLTDEEDSQWETICISENEVQSYTVTEEDKRQVLKLKLSEVVVINVVEGSNLTIYFSSSLDILRAIHSVYGHSKNKRFVGKRSTSVAKTTVKIVMDENSQSVVPESQISVSESEKNTVLYCLPAPPALAQMVTPARSRMSESTTFITSSSGGSLYGGSSISAVKPLRRGKGKPSLEMVYSCDRESEYYCGQPSTTAKTSHATTTPSSAMTHATVQQCDTSLKSKTSKLATRNKAEKYKKNIPLAKAVEMVLAGQGEGQEPLEQSFVPDTQPTRNNEKNTYSDRNKRSISEMLIMPTQKVNSDPPTSLAQQLECPSSAQRADSDLVGHKHFHSDLTQRLQKVLNEVNLAPPPQEPVGSQGRQSEISEDRQGRSSVSMCGPTLCVPKEQQVKKNGRAKEKSKNQMSLKADVALVKATQAKVVKETSGSVKLTEASSSKEMRDAEVAGGMVKLISSHYKTIPQSTAKATAHSNPPCWTSSSVNRPVFDMSWLSTAKTDVYGAVSLRKPLNKTTKKPRKSEDIFTFNINEPLSIGGNSKVFTDTSAISSSDVRDFLKLPSTTKKAKPVAKETRYAKRHLFSDTDTDYPMTEVSWIRESCRKPKPKITKYSRQACVNPETFAPDSTYESPDIPPPSSKPIKENSKHTKKSCVKEAVVQPKRKPAGAPNRAAAVVRRPQRAAATTTKSYREPDTDDSLSESEELPVPKQQKIETTYEDARVTKKTVNKQSSKIYRKLQRGEHQSSQSESDQPVTPKKCFVGQHGTNEKAPLMSAEVKKRKNRFEQSTITHRGLESHNPSDLDQPRALTKPHAFQKQKTEKIPHASTKLNKKNDFPVQEQTSEFKGSRAARQACCSPPSIEKMRRKTAEMLPPTLDLASLPLLTPRGSPLPASPSVPFQDTPSPIPLKLHSAFSSKGKFKPSSSNSEKCIPSKTLPLNSVPSLPSLNLTGQTPAPCAAVGPSAEEISPIVALFSVPQSPFLLPSQPLLASTAGQLDKSSMPSPLQSPFLEDTSDRRLRYDFSKASPVSHVSLSHSSAKSSSPSRVRGNTSAALAVAHTIEKTPSSDRNSKSAQSHRSGPSHKRHIAHSSSSNSEEDEKVEKKISKLRGQHSARMKPKKLLKSFAAVSAEGETSQVLFSIHAGSSSYCEVEVQDVDEESEFPEIRGNTEDMCRQFSSELKKKFQNRCKMMEVYSKQSLKTVQQHMSSLSVEVSKYRTQRLEKVRRVLLEEIHKLEQETLLKNMEKDLAAYWKKQSVAFRAYQQQETKRYVTLKETFESNVCHSLEYEERIFTSQMCLMGKDMKSVQDRLINEMHEGEIQTVKRGLHALFFPEGTRF